MMGTRLCRRARRDDRWGNRPGGSPMLCATGVGAENDPFDGGGSAITPVSQLELAAEVHEGQWRKQANFRQSWSAILLAQEQSHRKRVRLPRAMCTNNNTGRESPTTT